MGNTAVPAAVPTPSLAHRTNRITVPATPAAVDFAVTLKFVNRKFERYPLLNKGAI
jgi:hypothetical protein